MVRLANFQMNNDWSNTISFNNCVICHSQKFEGQPSGTIKPEYKNSEFTFQQLICTLIGITRYNLSTLISKMCLRLTSPPKYRRMEIHQT